MFGRGFGGLGKFLLIALTLVVSFTNTWLFMNEFLPENPFWIRPAAFVFFEGGFVFWARHFKHDSENVPRTIISGLMALVCLLAVLSATCYEIAKDVTSLGFTLDETIKSWIPLSILLVVLGQTVALALHYFADEHFFARLRHMNRTGQTMQLSQTFVTGQLVSVEQTGEMPALPQPQQQPAQLPAPAQQPQIQSAPRQTSRLGNAWRGMKQGWSSGIPQQQPQQMSVQDVVAQQKAWDEQQQQTQSPDGGVDPLADSRSE